jgi:hypothetical protein
MLTSIQSQCLYLYLQPDYQGLSGFEQWLFAYKNFGVAKGKDVFENNIQTYVSGICD